MRHLLVVLGMATGAAVAGAQTTELLPPAPQAGGSFGSAVTGVKVGAGAALKDNAVVASAGEDLPGGFVDAGRVRVYDSTTGALLLTIDPPNKQPRGAFGHCLAGLERINAGEFGEILVGAPRQRPGVVPPTVAFYGRAYIFDGHTGQMLRAVKSPTQQDFSFFGWAAAALGDLDADGYTDYAVSAPGEAIPQPPPPGQPVSVARNTGRVHLFSGRTGVLLRTFASPATTQTPLMPPTANPTAFLNFGYSVAGMPDATGDGKAELLVGAPLDASGTLKHAGRVYVFNGATGALVRTLTSPMDTENGRFGHTLAGMHDVNSDGRGDLVVGAPLDLWTGPGPFVAHSGLVYLFSGATGTLIWNQSYPGQNLLNPRFGLLVATVPDASGDGKPDVLVPASSSGYSDVPGAGLVYVLDGITGGTVRVLNSPRPDASGLFGTGAAGLRVPGGKDSVLVGAPAEDPDTAPNNSGRAYVLKMTP